MKRLLLSLSVLLSAISLFAQDSPLYIEKADSASIYIEREDWSKAEKLLLEALRLEPANYNNSLLLNNLARVMQQTGRDDEALYNYDLALCMAPSNSTIRYNRGLLLLSLSRTQDAIADFTKAAEAPESGVLPLLMRAFCYMKENNADAAEADFKKVLDKDDSSLDAMEGLAGIYLTDGRIDEAIEILGQALDKSPSADLYFRLGMAQCLSERINEAAESVREGIKLDPEYGNLYLLRAYIHQQRYQMEEMEADLRTGRGKGGEMELFKGMFRSKK